MKPLTPEQQKRVKEAIDRGVAYLRRTQQANGSFGNGITTAAVMHRFWPAGFAALSGLALLECGEPGTDGAVQKAAVFVRQSAPTLNRTYELALALLFLDRLGEPGDRSLIRSLALRLVAGQNALGAWTYTCPILQAAQEKRLLESLRKQAGSPKLPRFPQPNEKVPRESVDNSNTQFAILGLWVARKHDLPLDYPLALVERRFRAGQRPGGWAYGFRSGQPYGSMTCVGLLALAVGRGAAPEEPKDGVPRETLKAEDEGIQQALRALAGYLHDPADSTLRRAGKEDWGPNGAVNLYFLWSVERVGVFCNLQSIGGRDWYRWGLQLLLPTQRPDGSWVGRGSGGAPVVDTCFALLFLKRADLVPGLRQTLQQRLKITDPLLSPKDSDPRQSPGEKGPGPGQPPAPEGAALAVDLGTVKAGEATQRLVKVRAPAPFRIKAVRGTDAQLAVQPDPQSRAVHELTLTLQPKQPGDFERLLHLVTDLPGQPEVAVRVRLRILPGTRATHDPLPNK
ncbi:MAG: terpene cyclase/mutase family protein [Gemmataceae bacterium]|nr:terpene cyclase/mutase family protein [Gemmataceae bacterium]